MKKSFCKEQFLFCDNVIMSLKFCYRGLVIDYIIAFGNNVMELEVIDYIFILSDKRFQNLCTKVWGGRK